LKRKIIVYCMRLLAWTVFCYFAVHWLLRAVTAPGPLDLRELKTPSGFHITVFAEEDSPRMMVFSPGGVLIASDTDGGKVVALPDPRHTGKSEQVVVVLQELREPHGLAFYQGKLYVAETNQVRSYDWDEAHLHASNPKLVAEVPGPGGHSTRTLLFHNGKMYVSVGSTCNACVEKDPRRGTVMEFNVDGSGGRIFGKGLRNAVGMAVNPKTDTVWVTDNGRDWLGDDLPPETIYDLGAQGGDFGWPFCYGDRVPDPNFTRPGDNRCENVVRPKVQMQAHVAPLGLEFYEGTMFPPEYRNNIFVAFHGSWNRSVPTGDKLVRIKLDDRGQPVGGAEDFITGWQTLNGRRLQRSGRPVGIIFAKDGSMYVSDDMGGKIYRVTYGR
jgi:glucose/arabinose dehydrogenase